MTPSSRHKECVWTRDRIDPYLDDELATDEAIRFERHLDRCDGCREEMRLATRVLDGLRDLPGERCPDGIVDAVFEHITPRPQGPEPGRARHWLAGWREIAMRPALATAIVILVLAGGAVLERWHRNRNRMSAEDIARGEAALKWTVAYVNDVSRRASHAFRDEVIGERVIAPIRQNIHNMTSEPAETPESNDGGS